MNKRVALVLSFVCSVFFALSIGNGAYANSSANWSNSATKKGLLTGLQYCYKKGAMNSTIDLKGGRPSATETFNYKMVPYSGSELVVYLPSGLTKIDEKNEYVKCSQFLEEILKISGHSGSGDLGSPLGFTGVEAVNMVKKFGYEEDLSAGSESDRAVILTYKHGQEPAGYAGKQLEITYNWNKSLFKVEYKDSAAIPLTFKDVTFGYDDNGNKVITFRISRSDLEYYDSDLNMPESHQYTIPWGNEDGEKAEFVKICNSNEEGFYNIRTTGFDGLNVDDHYCSLDTLDFGDKSSNFQFINGRATSAMYTMVESIEPGINHNFSFTTEEKLDYYMRAIKYEIFNATDDNDFAFREAYSCEVTNAETMKENYIQVNVNFDNATKSATCGFQKMKLTDEVKAKRIIGFDFNDLDVSGKKTSLSLEDTIKKINALVGDVEEGAPIITPSTEDPVSAEDACYNAGIDSMSWVLCPTLHNLEDAAVGISSLIDDMLTIDTRYYDTEEGTFTAWGYARDVANILMVVVFLAIIVSQLTGYGIDNYGIKKILPKLVMMAIIVNLSFFICQLAIDLSNIIGNGIQNMLESIGRTIAGGDISSLSTFISGLAGWIMGGTAAAGTIASVAVPAVMIAEGGGAMAVIIVILAVLTILIGVLIFFLSLGARTMIIILFSVLSPLAFVCYILPNTQKLFKNWWRVFQTALVIYPICGAISGASFIVRAIVFGRLSSGNTNGFHPAVAVVTMLMPFLPFYALPTLLKGALNTLGVVGGALSALGNGMKSGLSATSHAVQSSQAYKAAQEQARLNRTRFNAGIDKEGNVRKKVSGFRRFISGGERGMAAARSQYIADNKAKVRQDYLMGPDAETAIGAALTNQQKAAEAEGVEDYLTKFNDLTRNGENEDALYDLMKSDDYKNNKSAQVAIARIALRRKDTASRYAEHFRQGGFASEDIERSVAKEMTTGKNSDVLRGASPLSFAFASAVNKGEASASDYLGWQNGDAGNGKTNAEVALETYITKGSELSAVKGSDLKAIDSLIGEGGALAGTSIAQRIKAMADDVIDNKDKIPLDYSKAETLARMSNKYESYSDKDGFKMVNGGGAAGGDGTSLQVPHGQALAENQYSAPDPDSAANPNNNGSAGGTQFRRTEQFANAPEPNANANGGAQSNAQPDTQPNTQQNSGSQSE